MKMNRLVLTVMAAVIMTAAFGQDKRYGIESVVLKKKYFEANRKKADETVYIADYGRKESREKVEVRSTPVEMTTKTFTLVMDGFIYTIVESFNRRGKSIIGKTAFKVKITGEGLINMNFLDLTDEIKEKYQIEEKGSEQFLGKECKRYDFIYPTLEKVTVLVWEGLTLKLTAGFYVEEITEIQENAVIASEKFMLPINVHFQELLGSN